MNRTPFLCRIRNVKTHNRTTQNTISRKATSTVRWKITYIVPNKLGPKRGNIYICMLIKMLYLRDNYLYNERQKYMYVCMYVCS
jgi:hypothetical protein